MKSLDDRSFAIAQDDREGEEIMDIKTIRRDFPILNRKVNGKPLVYLDSAATSQKPEQVLDAIDSFYRKHNANVHRGIHTLSVEATEAYEAARASVAKFVGVSDPAEIIFTRNATEAINLVAYAWGRVNIGRGDEIVTTIMEHHSNFVPWQQLAAENGAVLKVVPILENGELDKKAFEKALTSKTKLVAITHVSNVLGTINDVESLGSRVRSLAPKAKILIDGAQAVPHMGVGIDSLGCDFYVFTGHKMLGPMGIGVLWGRREILDAMPPFLFGGEMISKVTLGKTSWNELPWKFEAGTPNVGGAIGLAAACDYLDRIGMDAVRKHEMELTDYAMEKLLKITSVEVFGPGDSKKRGGVVAFNVGIPSTLRQLADRSGHYVHAHDVASILDGEGIAIRSGHHCAEPLVDFLGVSAVARASFYLYNTKEDIDKLAGGIRKVREVFKI